MKTLIINGSPRKNGNTALLTAMLKQRLTGEVTEIWAYKSKISPCIDCRYCQRQKGCKINDDMSIIYNDDYGSIVLASPVYMSSLTPPVASIASRLQMYYSAKRIMNDPINLSKKRAALILTAGGDGEPSHALFAAEMMFKILNADFNRENFVLSLTTDTLPAKDDLNASKKIEFAAEWLDRQ